MTDLPSLPDITMRPAGERFLAYKSAATVQRVLSANAAAAPDYPDLSKYENQQKIARSDPWVYVSVTTISRGLALVNYNVSTYSAEKKTGIVDHPIEQLLRKPNAFQSRYEFREAMSSYMLINGNAYIYLNAPEPGGIPTEFILLRPDRVRIVAGGKDADASRPVRGYVYTVSGIEVPIAANELIHRKFFNAGDDYYGLSPIEACALSVQADLGMATWNRNFFTRDNAVPSGIVNIKSMVGDTDYERIQREWRDAYGGNARKTAFIRGSELTYEATGTTHEDMDFIAGRTFEKELVYQVYGMPPGSQAVNATEANANAATEMLDSKTLWPYAIAEGEKWTAELAPLYGDNLIVEPEDFRVKDRKAELMEMQAAGPYLEINEVRARFWSLPPVPWGDKPATGAQALPGGLPGFGKPAIDATPQKIEAADNGKAITIGIGQDCYVLLSLANDPNIIAIQNKLKALSPALQWEDPANFHVTLVYIEGATDLRRVRNVLPKSINPVTFDVGPVGVFDNPDSVPIILTIDPSPELLALQSGLAASCTSLNLSLSAYSNPSVWKPHVTLGYANPGDTTPYTNDVATVSSQSIQLSISDGDNFDVQYTTKSIRLLPAQTMSAEVPRVYVSRPMRKEIKQFETYALKGKDIDAFTFKHTDPAIALALKALVDCDFNDLLDSEAYKAVTLQSKLEKKIAAVMSDYFDGLTQRIVKGIRHVYAATKALPDAKAFMAYFGNAWWKGELAILAGALLGTMHDAVDSAAIEAANAIEIATGVSIDTSVFYKLAGDWAKHYTDDVLKVFNQTGQDGIGAIISRYTSTPDATLDDLISAIQESRIVGPDRARIFAVTESTRAEAQGNYIAGDQIASDLGITSSVTQDDVANYGPPFHPYCRDGLTPQIQYDSNDNPVGMDYVIQGMNDDKVCEICRPWQGKLLSDVIAAGGVQ